MNIAKRQVAVGVGIKFLHAGKKCDDGPDLVVALDRDPARHSRILEAVLDDPEQLVRLPRPHRYGQVGWRWQHVLGNRIDWNPGRAMAECATSVEMGSAQPDHIGIVELRYLDAVGMPRYGISHAEVEETLN